MEVGEHHVKINAEIRAILWQTEKCQKLPANHQQLGRGMEQILRATIEGINLADTLILDF